MLNIGYFDWFRELATDPSPKGGHYTINSKMLIRFHFRPGGFFCNLLLSVFVTDWNCIMTVLT